MMHDKSKPDTNIRMLDAARFLQLLDPTATKFEFRTFDDNKDRKDNNLTRTFYGTLVEHWVELKRLNDKGAGVFVVVNETDGKGREIENIVRVRAVFIDLDGTPLEPVMSARYKPHIVNETSPEKWHCYWLVEGMPLHDFALVQRELINKFHSDPKIVALTSVMRLPGFYHCKAEPFLVRIIDANDIPAYPAKIFKRAKRPPCRPVDHDIEVNPDKAIAALDAARNNDVDEDMWFKLMASAWCAGDGANEVYQAFVRFSKQSTKHKDRRTQQRWRSFDRKPPRNIGPGTLYAHANETAPRWREAMLAEALASLVKQYADDVAASIAVSKAEEGSDAS
jgi:hypothetical protein